MESILLYIIVFALCGLVYMLGCCVLNAILYKFNLPPIKTYREIEVKYKGKLSPIYKLDGKPGNYSITKYTLRWSNDHSFLLFSLVPYPIESYKWEYDYAGHIWDLKEITDEQLKNIGDLYESETLLRAVAETAEESRFEKEEREKQDRLNIANKIFNENYVNN